MPDGDKDEDNGDDGEDNQDVTSLVTDTFIAEEGYDWRLRTACFYVRRFGTDQIERVEEVQDETGRRYRPLVTDHITKGLVTLPEHPEPTTFKDAFEEGARLASAIYTHGDDESKEIRHLVAIAQSSWFLDRFFPRGTIRVAGMGGFAPIIALRGPSGSGKNRLLNALRLNSYHPFFMLSTTRIPSIFRPLARLGGTLCIDEADMASSDETSEVAHFLNSRAQGTPIPRQNPEKPSQSDVFPSFGLTILTQRRGWDDNATEGRAIPKICEQTTEPIPTVELDRWVEQGILLMNKLLYLRLMYYEKVVIDKGERVEGITDHRLTAGILPLLAIGKLEPEYLTGLKDLLPDVQHRKKVAKSHSVDGLVAIALWDRVKQGLVDIHNKQLYFAVGTSIWDQIGDVQLHPLTTLELGADIGMTAKATRQAVERLGFRPRDAPSGSIRVGTRTARPIWFEPRLFEISLMDLVPDYNAGDLRRALEKLNRWPDADHSRSSRPALPGDDPPAVQAV